MAEKMDRKMVDLELGHVNEVGRFVHGLGVDGPQGYALLTLTALLGAIDGGLTEEDCVQNTRKLYGNAKRIIEDEVMVKAREKFDA